MTAFEIEMSAPVEVSEFTGGLGGPNSGGHQGPNWYIQFGMDLGAPEGTSVYAAFDGHVTKFAAHDPSADSPKVYGAQIFVRSDNDEMGGFYTHLGDVPDGVAASATVRRGDLLGTVMANAGIPPHLHIALVEIVGGVPGGTYTGVDLYQDFLSIEAGAEGAVLTVTFAQDGSAPTATTGIDQGVPAEPSGSDESETSAAEA